MAAGSNPFLEAALAYAARGVRVLPCSPDMAKSKRGALLTPRPSKPKAKDGGVHLATTDKATIGKWWKRWPEALIGLPTGPYAGLIVIDLNARKHDAATMLAALREFCGGDLASVDPETGEVTEPPICRTPSGGLHLWFAYPAGAEIGNRANLFGKVEGIAEAHPVIAAHVDVRGAGGYVIGPPGVMADGATYQWERAPGSALPALPARLLDLLLRRGEFAKGEAPPPPEAAPSPAPQPRRDPAAAAEGSKPSTRAERLRRIADIVDAAPVSGRGEAAAPSVEGGGGSSGGDGGGGDEPPWTGDGGGEDGGRKPAVKWPFGFRMDEAGLWHVPPGDGAPSLLCGPFDVLGLSRSEEQTGWSLAIRFKTPDGWVQSCQIPRADLAGEGSEVRKRLANLGLFISARRGSRERLTEALAAVEASERYLLISSTGWHQGGRAFALPDETIAGPDAEPMLFDHRVKGASYGQRGTLAEWQETVARLAEGHDRLALALGVAFAGPILEPLGIEGGGFHLVGPSSCGKTTALRVAGSVWGGGSALGFAQSWRNTANALEGMAAAHNDALLALDEIGLIDPRELDAAAYALAGGMGKGRLRSDGDLRGRARWRIAILSTGEVSLKARIAEGSMRAGPKAGQGVRIIDVPADAGAGLGLFSHPGPDGDPARLAVAIRDATGVAFGTSGPAFVRAFIAAGEDGPRFVRAQVAAFKKEAIPEGADGQVIRVAERFALAAAAGELASRLGVLPWSDGALAEGVAGCFRAWLTRRGTVGSAEALDAVTGVREFIQRHGASRFSFADKGVDETSWRVQNLAGFKSVANAEQGVTDKWLFTDAGFKEAIGSLDPRTAADALAEAGFLIKDASGKRKRSERIGERTMRVYVVKGEILEGSDDA